MTIDNTKGGRLVYAPDGCVLSGFSSNAMPPPDRHLGAVDANIRTELQLYGRSPAALYPPSVASFEKDLRLMDSLAAAPPVIVAAPIDHRIYKATRSCGWGARHRLILRLLARLRHAGRFSFLDLSNATAFGVTARDFYDGIHLTPRGARKVIDLVLESFPRGLKDPRLRAGTVRTDALTRVRPVARRARADPNTAPRG